LLDPISRPIIFLVTFLLLGMMSSALSVWIQEAQLQNLVQQESSAREAGAHAQQEADEAAEQVISIPFLFIGQRIVHCRERCSDLARICLDVTRKVHIPSSAFM
jgi:hypothetical protein